MLEITERIEVEVDKNSHHFCIAHETFSTAVFTPIRDFERIFLYLSVIFFTKIIDNTENVSNFVLGYHRECFCFVCLFCHYKDSKSFPNIQIFNELYYCYGNKNSLLREHQDGCSLIPNSRYYTLQGIKTNKIQKNGIYIVDGEKVVFK